MFTKESFEEFKNNYSEQNLWPEYSKTFHNFWKNLILDDKIKEIDDSEMDPIIRMLDQNGKGNTKGSLVVAKAFIRMGLWYRAFRSLKENKTLKDKLTEIFNASDDDTLIKLLDEFYKLNQNLKNGLTGKNAVILNALLFLNNPDYHICIVSLDHRKKIINYITKTGDIKYNSFGESIIGTNRKIINYFNELNIFGSPRILSSFLNSSRSQWDSNKERIDENVEDENLIPDYNNTEQVFVLEKYFEDFLIGNWESTELGKKYDLLYNEDDLISQQYQTDIGIIDILVKEKDTGNYVVIELKRNQTSDTTVGQLARYMGWVKSKLSPNNIVKGIIIGYGNDDKLNYAISCVPNTEIFLYRIQFSLLKP